MVERANEGTIEKRTDAKGLLVHESSDTWMDAVGPEGPWSPRGNRAVDVQALWVAQLEASLRMLSATGGKGRSKGWNKALEKARTSFRRFYVRGDGLGLYDNLAADNTPDAKLRPNQLFALTVPFEPLLSDDVAATVVSTVRKNMVYRWGVASLAQNDPDFHPYHQTHHYPKDAAYHNGIVWTWLSGPYKSASGRGWGIAANEIEQLLDWGAAGTISENLDAVPRDGNEFPYTSGTISQTWSLAEFIRTIYQDYIGLRPVYAADRANRWVLDPAIPLEWGDFTVTVWLRDVPVEIRLERGEGRAAIRVRALEEPTEPVTIELPKAEMVLTLDDTDWREWTGIEVETGGSHIFISGDGDTPFLEPKIVSGLKSLAPPPYRLLSGPEVKAENPLAKLIFDLEDPEGDELGDGGYGYPADPVFLEGILDLRRFIMRADEERVYFKLHYRELADPGWRPEYGYQLTFTTIAIRTGTKGEKRRREVGCNSNWRLAGKQAADRFVRVGGGLRVDDGGGEVLAAHVPAEPGYPLGDITTATISFSLPRELLPGEPEDWKLTVLVGAQDDHGGAGLGEYRTVSRQGGRWEGSGGGPGKSNVYDTLRVP